MKHQVTADDVWAPDGSQKTSQRLIKPLSFIPMFARGGDTLQRLAAEAKRRPDDAGAFEKLGIAHANAGDHAQAAQALTESVAIDPSRSRAWSALGEAQTRVAGAEQGPIPHAARRSFEQALALDPEDVRAQFYLAVDKDAEGAREQAIDDWMNLLRTVRLGSGPEEKIRAAILASLSREMKND